MPLKLNVGLSRKVGEANYGSRGASVNLELELDSGLVTEPERLQERIRQLFRLAKASVDEELHSDAPENTTQANDSGNGRTHAPAANGNGRRSNSPRRATQSQVRALWAIAERQQIDLRQCIRDQFGINEPDGLSISQASELIDELKSAANGNGGRR